MEIQCPSCKKTNEAATSCIRCSCELQTLRTIMQTARGEIAIGRNKLRRGNHRDALKHALRSWHLKNTPEAAKLAFLAHVSERRYEEALKWYGRTIKNRGNR